MTDPVWWYVLAGFILGFILSTLWEWLFFRRHRMRIENQRIAELEESVRTLTIATRSTNDASNGYASGYQSPGVFLEGEEDEIDTAEVIVPAPDPYAQPTPSDAAAAAFATSAAGAPAAATYVASSQQAANGSRPAAAVRYAEPAADIYPGPGTYPETYPHTSTDTYADRYAEAYAAPRTAAPADQYADRGTTQSPGKSVEPPSKGDSRRTEPSTSGAAVPLAAAAVAVTALARDDEEQEPEPALPAEMEQPLQLPVQQVQPEQDKAAGLEPQPGPSTAPPPPVRAQPASPQPASAQPLTAVAAIEPEPAPWLSPENVAALSAALGSTLQPNAGTPPETRDANAESLPSGQPTPPVAPSPGTAQGQAGTYPAPAPSRLLPGVYDLPDDELPAPPPAIDRAPPTGTAPSALRAILPSAVQPAPAYTNGVTPRREGLAAGEALPGGGLEPEIDQVSDTLGDLMTSLNGLIAKTQSLLDGAGKPR